jgi:hypothetical protein
MTGGKRSLFSKSDLGYGKMMQKNLDFLRGILYSGDTENFR